ncbi:hypothetical protein MMC19_003761 [Ptychographa xylographoides]|nr:hypothetical protein [Ptychographa xylographoides]
MSFGFGTSDIVLILSLAVRVYLKYKGCPSEVEELATHIEAFGSQLVQVENAFKTARLDTEQSNSLRRITDRSGRLLYELDRFYDESINPATGKLRKLTRLRWNSAGAENLRRRIRDQTSDLALFLSTAIYKTLTETGTKAIDNQFDGIPQPAATFKRLCDTKGAQVAKGSDDFTSEHIEIVGRTQVSDQPRFEGYNIPKPHQTTMGRQNAVSPDPSIRVSTESSGYSIASSSPKLSFFDTLSQSPPLAFNPSRARTKSSESSVSEDLEDSSVAEFPPHSGRRSSIRRITSLGSSAPSISQERSPFGAGFTSPHDMSRCKSERGVSSKSSASRRTSTASSTMPAYSRSLSVTSELLNDLTSNEAIK